LGGHILGMARLALSYFLVVKLRGRPGAGVVAIGAIAAEMGGVDGPNLVGLGQELGDENLRGG
jgi:hypothetical protein